MKEILLSFQLTNDNDLLYTIYRLAFIILFNISQYFQNFELIPICWRV